MTQASLLTCFELVKAVAAGVTATRLYRSGLYQRYPFLFSFMAFLALYSLCPIILNTRGAAYFWTWIVCQPVVWILDLLVVRELCRVVLERYPGLFTLGRWLMYIGVAASAVLSFLSLLPHIQSTMPARSKILGYWVAANRGVTLSLVIFLFLMLLAVSRYPVRLSRNAILNAVLFTVCFLSDSLGSILSAIFDMQLSPSVTVTMAGVEAVCLVVWLFCLTPDGEHSCFQWIHFGHAYEERVLSRLDALNRVLQRRV
jgi:hypothetical protein